MCWVVLISSDNMKVSIAPAGRHEGLSWVTGGPVIMGNKIYIAYVLHLKWRTGWCFYSQTSF